MFTCQECLIFFLIGESNVSNSVNIMTLCGTSDAVVDVDVDDISSHGMMFLWDRPDNYYGDISSEEYEVNLLGKTIIHRLNTFIVINLTPLKITVLFF